MNVDAVVAVRSDNQRRQREEHQHEHAVGRGARLAALASPFIGYLLVAVIITLRTWADPSHRTPGGAGDNFAFVDVIAWIPHALSSGHNPLFMSAVDYPHGVNLAWNTSVPLGAVLVWPITATLGPVVAFNVLMVTSLALDGWCVWLWLRRHVTHSAAAFLGGLLVLLGPWGPTHIPLLQLVSYWPVPLMLIATEKLIETRRPWTWGALLGLVAAIQFYLAPEVLAMAVIALGIGVLLLALVGRRRLREHGPRVVLGLAAAAVVCGVLVAPFVGYQLFGPYPIRGTVQPANLYVTDLQSLVVPTKVTWLWPHSLTDAQALSWTGTDEVTSYIGIPLMLIAVYAALRWRREPAVAVVAITALVVAVLSFGPHLHIGGHDTGIRLPGVLLARLPFIADLLPVRLFLLVDLGLAYLLAITLDRSLFRTPLRPRLDAALAVAALLSFVSILPMQATEAAVPAYFSPSGSSRSLPPGTVALVGPYIDETGANALPMVWQAEADFHFSLIDGLAITGDPSGHPIWLLPSSLRDAFHSIESGGRVPNESDALRVQLDAELHQKRVTIVILGPMAHRDLATQFVSWLLGRAPQETEGVSIWQLDTTAQSR